MSGSFRKSLLVHRQALMTAWPLAFPAHDFQTLRLIRSPLDWDEEAWAESARRYHEDRKRSASKSAPSKVSA
jgi:hypothetical protein